MITALVSAYHAIPFIENKISNLLSQSISIHVGFICKQGSYEHKIIETKAWDLNHTLITTPDIPPLYRAWNMLIEAIPSEYYATANTDDTFYRNGVEQLYRSLLLSSTRIICGSYIERFQLTGKTDNFKGHPARMKNGKPNIFLSPFLLWSKEVTDQYGLFDESYVVAGDHEFLQRCYLKGESIFSTPDPVGEFLFRKNSIEDRHRKDYLKEIRRIKALQ
jgi:hypothetical protein